MALGNIKRTDFSTREDLAQALAQAVAGRLRQAIAARGSALLAVSGGTTPARFFEVLSTAEIDWSRVTVTLVDDRFVRQSSPRSNAGLVKAKLLNRKAAAARFIGLLQDDAMADVASPDIDAVEAAAAAASAALGALALPLDAVILGMGADGHTASFFPDAERLEHLLDPTIEILVEAVRAPSAGEPRLTLTLPAITSARFIVLHIEGAEKQITLEKAFSPGATMPIRRVIDAAGIEVQIFWAP